MDTQPTLTGHPDGCCIRSGDQVVVYPNFAAASAAMPASDLGAALASWRQADLLAREAEQLADARFNRLTKLAFDAGFRPGREHAAVSIVEFAETLSNRIA